MECEQKELSLEDINFQADNSSVDVEKPAVSITQAAKLHNVTRQAIYVAIKQKKLKASKGTRWEITIKDLEEYKKNRYSRQKSVHNGELVFDNDKGFYSVNQVAEILGVPVQKVYYATRTGAIKGTRKGAAWVIHTSEVERYKNEYLREQLNKKLASKANRLESTTSNDNVSNVLVEG